jgi:hypothetical protein
MAQLLTQSSWRTFRIAFNLTAAVLALILAALLLVILASVAWESFTGDDDFAAEGFDIPFQPHEFPADSAYGLVTGSSRTEKGITVFGWDITDSTYVASVGFVVPPGCSGTDDFEMVAEGPCAGIPAEGPIWGRGTAGGGMIVVTVGVEVSKACIEALDNGDRWPTARPECAN